MSNGEIRVSITEIPKIREALEKADKEIERLNNQIEKYQKALDETTSEKIDLENIIKEVREYCKNDDNFELVDLYSQPIADRIQEELLEILDKVGDIK